MSDLNTKAMSRIEKARVRLSLERKFYGVLVANVEPVISEKFPTAATNGKQHFWNPKFISELTEDEVLGVQVHESEHDARHHGTRRNGRDPELWNIACDYAINIDLIDEGFTLPKGALIDPKYRGMSAEDIYRSRELDSRQPQPEPEQPGDDTNPDQNPDEPGQNPDEPGQGDDGTAGEAAGEGEGDEGQEDAPGAGNSPGEAGNEAGEASGDEPGTEPGDGTGNGADGKARRGLACTGEPRLGEAGEADGEGEPEQSGSPDPAASGDPGQCGQVLDSVGDANEIAEQDSDWERKVRQAVSMAKAAGQLPGYVSRDIERANSPPRDWRDELREFAEQGALRVETWSRPNRRFMGRGLILPSTQKDGVNKACFLIDTSGSCDQVALALVNDEAQALLDDGVVDQVIAIYGDTRVTRVDEYNSGDEIEFDPRGGGGTDMAPLFDYVATEHDDASPVLFAVHGYPQNVRRLMETAPWGARCIDVGVH